MYCNAPTGSLHKSFKLRKAVPCLRRLFADVSTRRSGVDPGTVQVSFVVDKGVQRRNFLQDIWFSAVEQWIRCCATNQKVAGSIPDGVIGIFHSLRSHYGPGVDSASNRNEYQEYFLRVKTAGA